MHRKNTVVNAILNTLAEAYTDRKATDAEVKIRVILTKHLRRVGGNVVRVDVRDPAVNDTYIHLRIPAKALVPPNINNEDDFLALVEGPGERDFDAAFLSMMEGMLKPQAWSAMFMDNEVSIDITV